ncbi:hypothetical protein [Paenirhodobacter populi]|uniref:Uncharacterized protein n=1 Tax=Paenirhodobacter populi TaxID=2306993 RepID=A0A443JN19_9RHOB|nr:hypothetical protein [Sinirhodobacter populi]RWR21901.1 hypothetical protein D2T30_07765 [Sinirhodobacter populi]
MSPDKIGHIDALGGRYVYRLESVWEIFEQYFLEDRPYRIFAQIDRIEDHAHIPQLQIGQSWCGLWFLTDVEDAIAFQSNEPTANALGASPLDSVVLALKGRAGVLDRPMRLMTRISLAGFEGRTFRPDLPLIHEYPSSMFDLRPANIGEAKSREGRLTAIVTMPSKHIEVFYDGRWYPKRLAIGRMIRCKILCEKSARGILFMK